MNSGSQLSECLKGHKSLGLLCQEWQNIHHSQSGFWKSTAFKVAALALDQDYPLLSEIIRPLTSSAYYDRQVLFVMICAGNASLGHIFGWF